MPALLLALGDDEAGGDVAQAEILLAQVQGHGQHRVVGDDGADVFAAAACRFVAFQGAIADVLSFHLRQGRQHGEHGPGRIVGALQLASEGFQAARSYSARPCRSMAVFLGRAWHSPIWRMRHSRIPRMLTRLRRNLERAPKYLREQLDQSRWDK
ncbi:hypothetical protein GCM10017600_27060 [Streptosporangium carneum]|uniref:Uncharacterized protein n=1 Tax=Streptosporangium carneum TaxID=47481 RepID=A0A9W6HZL5_9ACTN|nr:hypothetical protein [Streptosporangium carneum]GLK09300.1 hypothetical protein GCM10017600_27060 [Streptosporangium carneum]